MSDCPACGAPYTAESRVRSGSNVEDVLSAPLYSTFKRYARLCADPEDARAAKGTTKRAITVYLHRYHDVLAQPGPTGPHI